MHNPNATSTPKISQSDSTPSWAAKNDSAAMALFNATGAGGGNSKARPTMTRSGGGYDGTGDPGKPGEPV